VIVLSHFGPARRQARAGDVVEAARRALSKALGKPVAFAEDCIGPLAEDAVRALKPGEVLLLENLRFHKEEEKNDAALIDKLSVLGDVYVNDAFSARIVRTLDRRPRQSPARAAGRLNAGRARGAREGAGQSPNGRYAAVVGGAKVSSKLDLLGNLVGRVDKLIIGGGMANTFLARSRDQGRQSLCEKDLAPTALDILAKAKAANEGPAAGRRCGRGRFRPTRRIKVSTSRPVPTIR